MVTPRLSAALAVALLAHAALGRPHPRRHFEPTDLALEAPGTSELDFELGMVRSPGPWRAMAPDFELDVGLTKWLELDVDGAFAFEGAPGKPFRFDHAAHEPLWPSAKLGLLDLIDDERAQTYAVGAQLGPRLPWFSAGHGVGAEGLLLLGLDFGPTSLALNLGGFVDPAPARRLRRPAGLQAGLDWSRDLDRAGRYTLTGGVASTVFVTREPAQLQVAFGPSYGVARWLRLSLTSTVGLSRGSDRYGLLLGVAPRIPLW